MAIPLTRFFYKGEYINIQDVLLLFTVAHAPSSQSSSATKAIFSATTPDGDTVLLETPDGERMKEVPLNDTYFHYRFSTDLACALLQFAIGRKVEHSYIPNNTLHESTHCFTVV